MSTKTNDTAIDVEEIKQLALSDKKEGKGISEETLADTSTMGIMMKHVATPLSVGDLAEGAVIDVERSAVYIDLAPFGTGIIYGKEFMSARDLIKKISVGDSVTAKVIARENEDGYIELSLQEARRALVWSQAEEAIKSKLVFELPIKEANKGGLIIEWQGMQGFLPASQLKPEHYPRVENGDKNAILEELKRLVGEKIAVSIISADPKEGKLIFSEKDSTQKERSQIVSKYTIGDEIEGEVTGIVDFGVFLKIEEGLEGLVHISEIDWGLVEDPKKIFRVGDKTHAKIIEIKEGKISLSIKAFRENPWKEAEGKYKKGDIVKGVVIKFNQYGALASIEEGVAGLVHISEFGSLDKLKEKLELGKTYTFQITIFEPKDQKMTLSFINEEKQESPA